jgi:hypothetical protein
MPQRFIKKNPFKKHIHMENRSSQLAKAMNIVKANETKVAETSEKKVDNQIKEEEPKNMGIVDQIKAITGAEVESLPKARVKREKKDKGLIERDEKNTVILTEDNKILLND